MAMGLRERKRRLIAHELAQTAYDLTVERGLSGFTIEELTDRAGYARRTFTNYYSCKEEAVAALAVEELNAGVVSLPDFPDDTPLIEWLRALAKHQLSNGLMDVLVKLEALSKQNPGLEPYLSRVYKEIRLTAWQIVHKRFPDHITPQQINILVGAAYGALTMMLNQISQPSPESATTLDRDAEANFLDAVFDQLKTGF